MISNSRGPYLAVGKKYLRSKRSILDTFERQYLSLTLTNFSANAGSRSKAESRQPLSIFKDQRSSLFFIWFCFGKAHLDTMTFSAQLIESRTPSEAENSSAGFDLHLRTSMHFDNIVSDKKDDFMSYRI